MISSVRLLIVIRAFVVITTSTWNIAARAQESLWQFGVVGRGQMNFHSAQFNALAGQPSCCNDVFGGVVAPAFSGGLLIDYSLDSAKRWSLQTRVNASWFTPLTFQLTEQAELYNQQQILTPVDIRHSLTVNNLAYIAPELLVRWNIIPEVSVMLGAQVSLPCLNGLPLLPHSYTKKEEIITQGARFENGATIREQSASLIPERNIYIAPTIALSGNIPLSEGWTLSPEVFASYPIQSLVGNLAQSPFDNQRTGRWGMMSVGVGVVVRLGFINDTLIKPTPIDTLGDIAWDLRSSDSTSVQYALLIATGTVEIKKETQILGNKLHDYGYNVKFLFDTSVTQSNIRIAIDKLKLWRKSGDKLIVLFSGHGDQENIYLWNKEPYSKPTFITALNPDQKIDRLIILNACQSGGNLNAASVDDTRNELDCNQIQKPSNTTSIIFTATDPNTSTVNAKFLQKLNLAFDKYTKKNCITTTNLFYSLEKEYEGERFRPQRSKHQQSVGSMFILRESSSQFIKQPQKK